MLVLQRLLKQRIQKRLNRLRPQRVLATLRGHRVLDHLRWNDGALAESGDGDRLRQLGAYLGVRGFGGFARGGYGQFYGGVGFADEDRFSFGGGGHEEGMLGGTRLEGEGDEGGLGEGVGEGVDGR